MRQFFTKAAELKALTGKTWPDYDECDSETNRPKMKAWPSLPGRPDPGPEPRLRPLGEDEDVNAAMAILLTLKSREYSVSARRL